LLAAQVEARELRIGMKAAINSADPHLLFTPNRNVELHVCEPLMMQDERLQPTPELAIPDDGARMPASQFMAAGSDGHDATLKSAGYDPALSRRLLAEAGFPNGFGLTLSCLNGRRSRCTPTVPRTTSAVR
jgi:ABC-type transport system substrate-binding protein